MSRSSKRRHGRRKTVAETSRRSTKRKIRPSNKKLQRKLRRIVKCCICMNTQHGARKSLHCGHIFHKECIKQWLKEMARNCPTCRRDVPRNTGRHQRADPESRLQPPINRRPLIPTTVQESAQSERSQNIDNVNTNFTARSRFSDLNSYLYASSTSLADLYRLLSVHRVELIRQIEAFQNR